MRDERQYVIDAIRSCLDGSGGQWDWGEFTSSSLRSARLDFIRRRAAKIDLPLDADGETALRRMLDQAEQLSADGMEKRKPWRIEIGIGIGLLVGAILWWVNYLPGGGYFQNPHILFMPAVAGALIVAFRNRREEVGYYDPENIEENKRGRV